MQYGALILLGGIILLYAFSGDAQTKKSMNMTNSSNPYYSHTDNTQLHVSDAEWKKILLEGVYQVARRQETERAFTGEYWNNHKKGIYYCAVCGNPLFSSETKFESGTGWPSFYREIKPGSIRNVDDKSHGMTRSEVVCARCSSHLGHVFDDGPAPTHLRYCMNSAILDFEAKK